MTSAGHFLRRHSKWLAILLLLVFWARMLHTAAVKSDTFDEMLHIMYGVLYWQHAPLEPVVQNPPLVDALIGLPVSLVFHPTLPLDHPTWPSGNWLRIAQAFLWQINDNGLQLLWAGRLATMCMALLLGAVVYRWGRESGQKRLVGLIALLLYSFDPNILAHGSLATGDLGMTLFLCLAAYFVWRFWRLAEDGSRPAGAYLLAAVGIGFVLSAKFSGIVILPALFLIAGYRWFLFSRNVAGLKRTAAELTGWLVLAAFLFLIIYRFDLNALAADFNRQQAHQLTGHSTYLFGELSIEGWWYYFPIVFAVKTPLPILILIMMALIGFVVGRRYNWGLLWPLLVAGSIGAASMVSRVNIGYRYLLPALPLLYLFVGQWAGRLALGDWRLKRIRSPFLLPALFSFLLLWAVVESVFIHPDYLAYFNQLAGGPENGWRIAVDSNIDWGQDIKPLARYLRENDITQPVNVAWLGTAPLSVYGIQGTPLPAWPVASEEMLYSPFYPPRPAPGLYVLSATQLPGVYLSDPERFAWFQQQSPNDRVGYSLFVYDVPADGPPVGVALSGVGLATVTPSDFDQTLASNNVSPRWYDARTALLWPAGTPGNLWTIVGEGHLPNQPRLQALYPPPTLSGQGKDGFLYQVFNWHESPVAMAMETAAATQSFYTNFGYSINPVVGAVDWETRRQPLTGDPIFGETFQLLGYEMNGEGSADNLTLMTYWRITNETAASQWNGLRIFVHLLDGAGQVVAQHDGLDVRLAGLQAGDELIQLHQMPIPAWLPPGQYALQIGLYEPESNVRLMVPTPSGPVDRLLLHRFFFERP